MRIPAGRNVVFGDQETCDRSANDTGRDQSHGIAGDPEFQGVCDPKLIDEGRGPGQRGTDASGQRDGADHESGLGVHAEGAGDADAGEVLQEDERRGHAQEYQQRKPTRYQGAQIRPEADSGEEVQQQPVAYLELEGDLQVEDEIGGSDECGAQKATDDRFRNAVAPEYL